MGDGGEGSQELMVKGKVASLSVRQLPAVGGEGTPGLLHTLLEYSSNVFI